MSWRIQDTYPYVRLSVLFHNPTMRSILAIPSLALVALFPSVLAFSAPINIPSDICTSPTVVSENYVGENKDVKLQVVQCANSLETRDSTELLKRQANVCGATCNVFRARSIIPQLISSIRQH